MLYLETLFKDSGGYSGMNTTRTLVVAGIALALGVSAAAQAAKQKEEDSAYKWGRWAVLSPAAGGEPYRQPLAPDVDNNARPGEAEEFEPRVLTEETNPTEPPVEIAGFCDAGASCGYATYANNPEGEGRYQAESVPEGFDLSNSNANGPVLARFDLETAPGTDQFYAAEVDSGNQTARFRVYDTGNPDFPDVDSVQMDGGSVYFSGVERTREAVRQADGSDAIVSTERQSRIEKQYDFTAVDTGAWNDTTNTRTRINDGIAPVVQFDFSSRGGFFAYGQTATIEQMEQFAAGNVTAVYQGTVIDYGSSVTMEFDLGERTVRGTFATENGFNGFVADGHVDGVNFAGGEGDRRFTGSFFSGAENVSGAVSNGAQLGVFSADHVHP